MEKMLVTSIFSFPTMFATLSRRIFIISATFNLSSANALNLGQSKILSFGKETNETHLSLCNNSFWIKCFVIP